jgi:hypothetical protein
MNLGGQGELILKFYNPFYRIKGKINNPPKNIDDQEVSKKFLKFIKLKNEARSGKSKFNREKFEFKLKQIHNFCIFH